MADSSGPVIVLLAIAGLMLFLSAYAAAQRRIRAAAEFAALMAIMAVYTSGYGLELTRTTIGGMLAVIRFENFGVATIPAFWLLFTLRFSGYYIAAHQGPGQAYGAQQVVTFAGGRA